MARCFRFDRCAAVLLVAVFVVGCADSQMCPREKVSQDAASPAAGKTNAFAAHFDDAAPGALPASWSAIEMTTRSPATWQVMPDASAPSGGSVFALTKTDNYDGTFNLAIAEGTSFGDLDLCVKVKAVRGEEDQGGGPIWRCRDAGNYYISRFNPLESNFRVYVVADGRRRQLDSAKMELSAHRWYELRIRMIGNEITCWLDGKELLHATDDTFAEAGMIGLWTKADAVTSFDDLVVSEITARR